MRCAVFSHEPCSLQRRYVRELILVAESGGSDLQTLFLERYREQLGCVSSWLPSLGTRDMAQVFQEAAGTRTSHLTASVLSHRLAIPRWFRVRVPDPWSVWRENADYWPGAIALDPVCLMFLDTHEAGYVTQRGGESIYFCCEQCQRLFDGDDGASAVPIETVELAA